MNALIKFICEICQCFEEIFFFFLFSYLQMNERMREKEKHDSVEKEPTILFELYGKFRRFYIGVNEFRERIVSVEIK